MYADDTHLTYAGDSTGDIESRLNHDLENVKKWLIANKLTLNMTKTEFMLIGSRQRLYALTNPPIPEINGAPITQVFLLLNPWACLLIIILTGVAMSIN